MPRSLSALPLAPLGAIPLPNKIPLCEGEIHSLFFFLSFCSLNFFLIEIVPYLPERRSLSSLGAPLMCMVSIVSVTKCLTLPYLLFFVTSLMPAEPRQSARIRSPSYRPRTTWRLPEIVSVWQSSVWKTWNLYLFLQGVAPSPYRDRNYPRWPQESTSSPVVAYSTTEHGHRSHDRVRHLGLEFESNSSIDFETAGVDSDMSTYLCLFMFFFFDVSFSA